MSKNGMGHSSDKENGNVENRNDSVSGEGQLSPSKQEQKEDKLEKVKTDHPADASAGESLLRMEVHKRQLHCCWKNLRVLISLQGFLSLMSRFGLNEVLQKSPTLN